MKFIATERIIQKSHLPLLIAPLLLFVPLIFTGKALVWGTVSTQFIPWWDFAWDTLLQGKIPLWNPWVGMGAPLVANYQSAIFYPPYWFLLILYAIAGIKWMSWGVSIVVVFHLILSGIGTAKLLEELEQGELAQVIGGLAFSLSGYLVARASFLSINAAAAWLPWILLYSYRIVNGKKNAFWSLMMIMALQLLAGHAQTTWYSILLGGIWILFLAINSSTSEGKIKTVWKSASRYLLSGLLAVGISSVQLIPTAEYLLQSQRSGEYGFVEAMTYSFWPWRFLTLIVPNLFGTPAAGNYWGYGNYWEDAVYIGLLPLLMALSVVVKTVFLKSMKGQSQTLRNTIIFLGVIVIVSFWMALGDNTFLFPFLYRNIPTFGSFQAPTRFNLWAEISLAILAGVGINQIERAEGKRKYWMRLAAAGCIAVIGGAIIGSKFLLDAETTFFIPIGMAGLFGFGTALLILFKPASTNQNKDRIWNGLLVLLVAADLIIAGWGLNPGVGIWFYDVKKEEDKSTRILIDPDLEYDLKFNKYFRFESFTPEVAWEDMHQDLLPNVPMLRQLEMVNNFDPLVPADFELWLDEFRKLEPVNQGPMIGLMNLGQIHYESEGTVERMEVVSEQRGVEVWIADLIDIKDDKNKTLEYIVDQRDGLENGVIIASSPSVLEANCRNEGVGVASINSKSPGYINISTSLENNSWMFWSQSWYPGWVAIIDGKQRIEVEKANFLFQAVCVPAGQHIVEIVYRPLSFTIGWVISAMTAVSLTAAWILKNRKKTRNKF